MGVILACMAAKDGLSFRVLSSFEKIKNGYIARKFNTVRSMIFEFEKKVRDNLNSKLGKMKAKGEGLSLSFNLSLRQIETEGI